MEKEKIESAEKVPYGEDSLQCMVITLSFCVGIPSEDGWYFVELNGSQRNQSLTYDVDYCRARSPSDGGGREWVKWYPCNIRRYAKFPA